MKTKNRNILKVWNKANGNTVRAHTSVVGGTHRKLSSRLPMPTNMPTCLVFERASETESEIG
jgi:hypothetical protein